MVSLTPQAVGLVAISAVIPDRKQLETKLVIRTHQEQTGMIPMKNRINLIKNKKQKLQN